MFHPTLKVYRFVSWLASERKRFTDGEPGRSGHQTTLLTFSAVVHEPTINGKSLARIAITPQLTFGGAQLVDIDANQPLESGVGLMQKAIT